MSQLGPNHDRPVLGAAARSFVRKVDTCLIISTAFVSVRIAQAPAVEA